MPNEPKPHVGRARNLLDAAAAVAVIGLSVTVIWSTVSAHRSAPPGARKPTQAAEAQLPSQPLSLAGAQLDGNPRAPVAIVEYSDFQCPYCGVFARDTLPKIRQRYTTAGEVVLAFRQFPLTTIHPFALNSAIAAKCAAEQDKYWEMHDALFQDQRSLDDQAIQVRATALGLDRGRFSSCMAKKAVGDEVDRDVAEGKTLGVSGTPTFFIGLTQPDGRVKVTQRLTGAQPLDQLDKVIDSLLEQVSAQHEAPRTVNQK